MAHITNANNIDRPLAKHEPVTATGSGAIFHEIHNRPTEFFVKPENVQHEMLREGKMCHIDCSPKPHKPSALTTHLPVKQHFNHHPISTILAVTCSESQMSSPGYPPIPNLSATALLTQFRTPTPCFPT